MSGEPSCGGRGRCSAASGVNRCWCWPCSPSQSRRRSGSNASNRTGIWLHADLYVATPSLLAGYGVDLDAINTDTEILTVETGDLAFNGNDLDSATPEMVTTAQTLTASYSSLPGSFITPEGLERRGWTAAASGQWLIETSEPLTSDQLVAARDVAASARLTIEARDQ